MDKKKKRKITVISICLVLVVALIVGLVIYGNRKSGAVQFAQENSDELSFNPFVENEERSDNSLLEYGKVLSKYGTKYSKYTGEDIEIDASNYYGISYKACTGETVYLYRESDENGNFSGEPTSVVYRGKTYSLEDVRNKAESTSKFATDEFIEEIETKLEAIKFDEDYTYEYKEDIDDNRDEDGYTTASEQSDRYVVKEGVIEADEKAVQTTTDCSDITFIYDLNGLVNETALYSLELEYFLPANRQNTALVSLKVDNKLPFKEADNMELDRTYNFYDIKGLDIGNNEIRSQQQEIFAWKSVVMENPEGLYKNPYRFLIQDSSTATSEKHRTISITLSREPAVIRTIKLVAPLTSESYEEYKVSNHFSEDSIITDCDFTLELETPVEKNDTSIRAEWDGNYCTLPESYRVTRYNYFGGDRWSTGGQSATWTFTVEKTGWYQIGFRYKNTLTDIVAYREIKIDGEIPFEEVEEYCFPYSDGWYAASLMDEDQNPYYFYLTEGEHTITLTAKVGPLREAIQSVNEAIESISELVNTVVSITGAVRNESGDYTVDSNRDWDLDKYIAGIQEQIDSYRDLFAEVYELVQEANGGTLPYYGSSISVAKVLFEDLSEDLEEIPSSLNEMTSALTNLSTALTEMTEQPLAMDYMVVTGGNFDYSECRSNGFQNLKVAAIQFKDSFVKDYTILGQREETSEEEEAKEIEVYVGRGREYVEILKSLIAEDFTPTTGIKVKVNMVSGGVEGLVMLRYVTGTAPDVAISVGTGSQVDYACRGALVAMDDLDGDGVSENLDDFNAYREENFCDGVFTLARYRGKYYSIPETQTWAALFYRTDILEELGLSVPDTWEDVYELLPTLQENGMDFYYPYGTGNLFPFVYQNGGSFYDVNGLESTLLSDESYNAFVEYANLYNKYNIPYAANFYMKFKMGEMPIGLADMGTYCQLKYSAPEIEGKWAMAPVPGHIQYDEDGNQVVNRSCGVSSSCCILIKNKTDLKSQEGWEFIKWWMSTDVQVAYAQDVEATFGIASRWSTANKNAVQKMAYTDDELAVINEQWEWIQETPNVLGGYYTTRYLMTALNQSVLQGGNMRIALEDAVREINKEMKRKQEEFFPDGVDSIIWAEAKEEGYDEP